MTQKLNDHITLSAEYGQTQHVCCKTIYENPTDDKLIVKMGKRIHALGGIQALASNYAILKHFSPYSKSTDIEIKLQVRIIESLFEEVSPEWKS
jgi:hypothetical protein